MINHTTIIVPFSHLYQGQPVIWFTAADSATLCFGLWQWQLVQPLMPIQQLADIPLVGRVIANDPANTRWRTVIALYEQGNRDELEAYITSCWLEDTQQYQHAGNAGMTGTWSDTLEGDTSADVRGAC